MPLIAFAAFVFGFLWMQSRGSKPAAAPPPPQLGPAPVPGFGGAFPTGIPGGPLQGPAATPAAVAVPPLASGTGAIVSVVRTGTSYAFMLSTTLDPQTLAATLASAGAQVTTLQPLPTLSADTPAVYVGAFTWTGPDGEPTEDLPGVTWLALAAQPVSTQVSGSPSAHGNGGGIDNNGLWLTAPFLAHQWGAQWGAPGQGNGQAGGC